MYIISFCFVLDGSLPFIIKDISKLQQMDLAYSLKNVRRMTVVEKVTYLERSKVEDEKKKMEEEEDLSNVSNDSDDDERTEMIKELKQEISKLKKEQERKKEAKRRMQAGTEEANEVSTPASALILASSKLFDFCFLFLLIDIKY